MLQLTESNYYSLEADHEFMSYSQFKNFTKCEAMAMAKLSGWQEPGKEALLVGSYVHSWNESPEAFTKFKSDHPEICTAKGELKSPFKMANAMIETLQKEKLIQLCLSGKKEQIVTGEWAGTLWKCKIDSLEREKGRFADLKTVKSMRDRSWNNGSRSYEWFVSSYGYIGQMALYSEIERIDAKRDYWLDAYMAFVTKEEPPAKEVIAFSVEDRQDQLDYIAGAMPRVLEVKSGKEKPRRCENCAYCRETRILERVYDYREAEEIYMLGRDFEDYRRPEE